ncbi:hypothetical protein [Streptosporangium roseum]|uniref:hypothetical protein n=1 Tax=Streptosporangium roseum TaxID=2001 RepID=UPI0033277005
MTLRVRDPYGNVTEIHPSARPFWEHREGHTILDDSDEPAQSVEVVAPAESGTTKRTTKQAATQPAQNVEE